MPTPRPLHGSIPGYRPGPILSRGHKTLLLTLAIGPLVTYGIMKLHQSQRNRQERLLEEEGRAQWEKEHGNAAREQMSNRMGGGGRKDGGTG